MKKRKTRQSHRLVPIWLRIVLAVGAISVVIYYSIVPPPGSSTISTGPAGILPISYWLHFISYAGLTILLGFTTAHVPRPEWQIWVFIIVAGIGIVVEMIQYTIPARSFSFIDIYINILGVLAGLFLLTMTSSTAQRMSHHE